MPTIAQAQHAPSIKHGVAFKMGNNILDKWGCSAAQKQAILGIPKSSFHRYQKDPDTVSLSADQLERLSYLANIHQALKLVFSNPDNAYGFMSMVNNNPYFNGKTPLSIISTGNFGALYEVFKRIDCMRNGQW
jgi:uncharacterized protein (DUF2384 family)